MTTFVKTEDAHYTELMKWFPDKESCAIWGGPDFRFPFTAISFREDLRPQLPQYSIVADDGELLAFGQYYLRAGRCHVAFLAVRPNRRGHGLGYRLIYELSRIGRVALSVHECSLFVREDNLRGLNLYERMGFATATYPENDMPHLAGVLYMIASKQNVDRWELG
jgi:ribosomal protein S18 acetylase RimI-like enzyme